jgi:hypothetical protein
MIPFSFLVVLLLHVSPPLHDVICTSQTEDPEKTDKKRKEGEERDLSVCRLQCGFVAPQSNLEKSHFRNVENEEFGSID